MEPIAYLPKHSFKELAPRIVSGVGMLVSKAPSDKHFPIYSGEQVDSLKATNSKLLGALAQINVIAEIGRQDAPFHKDDRFREIIAAIKAAHEVNGGV